VGFAGFFFILAKSGRRCREGEDGRERTKKNRPILFHEVSPPMAGTANTRKISRLRRERKTSQK
jgi:hypothetical protein